MPRKSYHVSDPSLCSHRRVSFTSANSWANNVTINGQLSTPLSLWQCVAVGCPPPPLAIHERVVWPSDSGPEFGCVKWLGKLPDLGPEWMAGVDFVNPIGAGTGLYNEYQLFYAPLNHASLVPVCGLIKVDDYMSKNNPFNGDVFQDNSPVAQRFRFKKR